MALVTILTLFADNGGRKGYTMEAKAKTPTAKRTRSAAAGMKFVVEPVAKSQVSMGQFMQRLDKFRAKYPQTALRKGEKGANQQLSESRSAGY